MKDLMGPPGSYGCDCLRDDAVECAVVRATPVLTWQSVASSPDPLPVVEMPVVERCPCFCHAWRTAEWVQ